LPQDSHRKRGSASGNRGYFLEVFFVNLCPVAADGPHFVFIGFALEIPIEFLFDEFYGTLAKLVFNE
jgi:hypothetical protein